MCGLTGFWQQDAAHSNLAPMAQAMSDRIIHRGPDDSGVFTAPGVAIGNRRLSIIDIAGGHQPFVSDDGRIALVQNGEIFNHLELRAALQAGKSIARPGAAAICSAATWAIRGRPG